MTMGSGEDVAEGVMVPPLLLVDDRADNLLALEEVLKPLGWPTVSVRSGEQALRRLLHEEFAVIILDVQMPGMDGFETARLIKSRPRTRHIPIIFLTAISGQPEHFLRGYELGAIDYVYKPFEPEILRSKVTVLGELWARGLLIEEQREELARRVEDLQRAHEALARQTVELEQANGELQRLARTATEELDLTNAVLARAGRLLVPTLEPNRAIEALLELVVPDLADWAIVHLGTEGADLDLVGVRHRDAGREGRLERFLRDHPQQADDPGGPAAVRTGDPQVVWPVGDLALGEWGSETAAFMAVPLSGQQGPVGAVSLVRAGGPSYSKADVELASELGRRAGLAIDTAQVFVRERDIASALQHRLLPTELPAIAGLDVAAAYQTGAIGAAIGGDWYDLIRLDAHRVAITVGDVVGHGSDAAAIMGQVRAGLRSYALQGYPPAGVISRLAGFVDSLGVDLVTCCYTELSLRDGAAITVSAGHPPPLLVIDGEARFLDVAHDLALGPKPDWTYHERTTLLPSGSRLVYYSDGLVEVPGEPLDLGLQRLQAAGSRAPGGLTRPNGSSNLLKHILSELEPFIHGQDDLIALVAEPEVPDQVDQAARRIVNDVSTPQSVRHWAAAFLDRWGVPDDEAQAAILIIDELIANAITHTTGPTEIVLTRQGTMVRVEVQDPSDRLPRLRRTSEDDVGGRGLQIVAKLASDWGSDLRDEGGKTVWFEIEMGGGSVLSA
jgi:CheY-like chemotaxis protein/anti-sigma regulatory factor (Ser/Thr protein kinase)